MYRIRKEDDNVSPTKVTLNRCVAFGVVSDAWLFRIFRRFSGSYTLRSNKHSNRAYCFAIERFKMGKGMRANINDPDESESINYVLSLVFCYSSVNHFTFKQPWFDKSVKINCQQILQLCANQVDVWFNGDCSFVETDSNHLAILFRDSQDSLGSSKCTQ